MIDVALLALTRAWFATAAYAVLEKRSELLSSRLRRDADNAAAMEC